MARPRCCGGCLLSWASPSSTTTVNRGKKHALTEGVSIASGQVLAFTDSDCVLAPDALSRCVHALVTNPDFGAVSGHARALNADDTVLTRAQDTWYDGQFRVAKAAEATFGSVTCVSGPLAVFRRDAIMNYLPAWANDTFLGREFRFATDRQLTGYVLGQVWKGRELKRRYADSPLVADQDYPERHWRVGYVRSAHVWTTVPARIRPFLKQQVRWKKSFIRNLCFTGSFMWRRGPGAAALFYGHALFVAVAPLMAVRHLVWAPANGLFLLTALYLCGVLTKGFAWAIAFKISNPGTSRWRYRPLMSLARFGAAVLAAALFAAHDPPWHLGAGCRMRLRRDVLRQTTQPDLRHRCRVALPCRADKRKVLVKSMSSADMRWSTRIGRASVQVSFALLALGLVATPFAVAWYLHMLGLQVSEQHSTPAAVLTPDQRRRSPTATGAGLPSRTPPVVLAYHDVRPIAPTEKYPDPTTNPGIPLRRHAGGVRGATHRARGRRLHVDHLRPVRRLPELVARCPSGRS